MFAVPEELRPLGAELVAALQVSVPTPQTPTIVHGDYRLGNLMFDGDELQAVVDWEIWGIGDRRVDLGWFLTFLDQSSFPGLGIERRATATEQSVLQDYLGDSEPFEDFDWFLALGKMKLAAIMAHNLKRHRLGKHIDPYLETLPPTIAALIASGLQITNRK